MSKRNGRRRGNRGHKEPRKPVQVTAAQTKGWQTQTAAGIASTTSYTSKRYSGMCDHWQNEIALEEGLTILASGWMDRPFSQEAWAKSVHPDVGVYLDNAWAVDRYFVTPNVDLTFEEDTQTVILPWDDYSTPESMRRFETTLKWLFARLHEGLVAEVGCLASHGRTGTILSCMLVMQGLTPEAAIRRVRESHCRKAVENHSQREWVRAFSAHIKGETFVPMPLRRDPPVRYNEASGYTTENVNAWLRGEIDTDQLNASRNEKPAKDYSLDDDEDYRMWLRLNCYDESLIDELTDDERRYIDGQLALPDVQTADDVCHAGACIDRSACNWEDGECLMRWAGANEYERWEI